MLCGDKPGERERPGRRPKVKDKATATYHGLFKNRSKNTCAIAGTQAHLGKKSQVWMRKAMCPPRCRLGIPRGTFADAIGYERSSAGEK